ncbi:MAG TPA: hypothetical protein PKK60_03890 [archaeon]|nr:hypothetical protein [archaeon]
MPKLLNNENAQKEKNNKLLDNPDFIPIILDTNFLLTMVRYKIHGLDEIKTKIKCKFFTMSRVMFELEALGKREKKIAKELLLVKQIIKVNNIKIIDSTTEDVDKELVEKSKEGNIIATNDKNLRERIKKVGGKSIYIRSLNFIETSEIEEN